MKMSDNGKIRLFIEVGANEVDRSKSYGCKTVKGTHKTHCVLGFSCRDQHNCYSAVYRAFVPCV